MLQNVDHKLFVHLVHLSVAYRHNFAEVLETLGFTRQTDTMSTRWQRNEADQQSPRKFITIASKYCNPKVLHLPISISNHTINQRFLTCQLVRSAATNAPTFQHLHWEIMGCTGVNSWIIWPSLTDNWQAFPYRSSQLPTPVIPELDVAALLTHFGGYNILHQF